MPAYTGSPIVDPDSLSYALSTDLDTDFAGATDELIIDHANKKIALKVTGTLGTDGATIKCVYSKLKEIWRTDATLIKFSFAMGPITDEQFELVNGWNWDKTNTSGGASANTTQLLRTGGWSVVNTSGNITEQWAGVVTLGTMVDSTDQVYYQQVNQDTASVNFKLSGPVNQAVQTIDDPNGDGAYGDGFDRRTYFKIFVREYAKQYAQSAIADIGVTSLSYQAYRFPLSNSNDLKITHIDAAVGGVATSSGSWSGGSATINTASAHGLTTGDSVVVAGVTPSGYNGTYTVTVSDTDTFTYTVADPGGVITVQGTTTKEVYTKVNITYLRHTTDARYNILGDYNPSSYSYALADVTQSANGRWYKCILAYTSNATEPESNATNWSAYEGERQIGASWYAFNVIIDADTDVAAASSGDARTAEIYEKVQWSLRQNSDIDADATASVTGKTADALLRFVGDTLVTSTNVYIDSFNTQDTNAIEFYDWSGTSRTFPYVASLVVNFGDNLQNDQYAKYWVFFTNAGGNQFGTTNAIIVDDNDAVDMSGDVNPAWPTKRASVTHSFNYDGNVQGGRTAGTNADITAVAIGLGSSQYVKATGTIARSTSNAISLVSALERNYSNL